MTLSTHTPADYLADFTDALKNLFHEQYNIDELSKERGLPEAIMDEILSWKPLAMAIPKVLGGWGSSVKEILGMLSAASYESLPLSLTFGINIGLFLGPLGKYGEKTVQHEVLDTFIEDRSMGGLMLTEPGHGSDALNMKTCSVKTADGYAINGTKHWQGLTGLAKYWLVAARNLGAGGSMGRDVDFYVCNTTVAGQQIEVEEYYDALGLYMIPYGRNKVDIQVPLCNKLVPQTTGINMMLDILHRSRMQFPGMALGFIKRMLDEAITHCTNRMVGATNLLSKDHIINLIGRLQAHYTVSSAMCLKSAAVSGIDQNLTGDGLEANCIKALVTDHMQEAAQILVQVSGASGYRISHIGGRGIADSRPFQIFEGANELLYTQIGDAITRLMKREKETNLYDFLAGYTLTARSCGHFRQDLSITITDTLPQGKLLVLGRAISYTVAAGYVMEMSDKGFRKELADNCLAVMRQDVTGIMTAYNTRAAVKLPDDYEDGSDWGAFA